jgi:flagellar biosynthesis protein FlhG
MTQLSAQAPVLSNPAHAARARLVAVASGKGGVGKTWFSITLAHALAARGCATLLFDGDLGLANVDIQLGLNPVLDLSSVLAGRATLAETAIAATHGHAAFFVMPGRSGSGGLAGLPPATIDTLLMDVAALPYDIVVLDLGAGIEAVTRLLAARADTLLVIATDEPTSLTDAYAVIKLRHADAPGGDTRVVINQAASPAAGQRTYATLARACANFLHITPPLAGIIRRDDRVRDAIRRQMPLLSRHPASPAGADVTAIAETLSYARR